MTPEQLQEFVRCKSDPVYFIEKYCKIEHPTKGLIPFALFSFQKNIVGKFKDNRFNIVNKSRQCLPKGTYVNTPSGIKRIEDFKIGDSVYSYNLDTRTVEVDTIKDAWKSGDRECVVIKLRNTRNIEVGKNHPFYIENKGWIKAENLERGDKIVEEKFSFGDIAADPNFVKVLAYLITDGSTLGQIKFTNNNIQYLTEFAESAMAIAPTTSAKWLPKLNGFDVYISQFHGTNTKNPLMRICEESGIANKKTIDKLLPEEVFSWNKDSVSLLINRMFAADGWISILKKKTNNKRIEIGIASPSKDFLEQVEALLHKFDIAANIYEVKNMKLQKNKFFKLRITHSKAVSKFVNEIGIFGKIKEEHLQIIKSIKHDVRYDSVVKSVKKTATKECWDISVSNNENFFIDGLLVHNTGVSTITASFALWKAIFHKRQRILVISIKDQDAQGFLDKIKVAFHSLPAWLKGTRSIKGRTLTDNAHELELDTGSVIRSVASGKSAARGQSLSLLIVDECAFIRDIDEIWKSAYPTLSTGGSTILISTPNGISNFFAMTWERAQPITPPEDRNDFNATFVHWKDIPYYDEAWFRKMRPQFTDKQWAQEYEGDFLGSGDTVIDGKRLKELKELIVNPIRTEFNERLWIWKDPVPGHMYIVGVDTALGGENGDYSTIQILDIMTGEQVAEYMGRVTVPEFSQVAYYLGQKYNEAYLITENTGIGMSTTIQLSRNLGYANMYMTENLQSGKLKRNQYGFSTNTRTRPLLVAAVQQFCYGDAWRLYSARLWNELTSFIWTAEGKAEHDKNKHDDLIFALGLAVYNLEAYMRGVPIEMLNPKMLEMQQQQSFVPKINEADLALQQPQQVVEAPPPEVNLFKGRDGGPDDDLGWL